MTPGRRKEGGGPDSWADGLDGVRPLSGRDDRVRDKPKPTRTPPTQPARFHFDDAEDPSEGFSDGIADAQRRKLRQGRIRPERRIDLHGLRSDEARRICLAELQEAIRGGERCVLVVHGKGKRSADGPVLRRAFPTWLADPVLEGRVLAFAPAQPEDGGRGASYVLMRRRRGTR